MTWAERKARRAADIAGSPPLPMPPGLASYMGEMVHAAIRVTVEEAARRIEEHHPPYVVEAYQRGWEAAVIVLSKRIRSMLTDPIDEEERRG